MNKKIINVIKNKKINKIVFKDNPFNHVKNNKNYYNVFFMNNDKIILVEKFKFKDIIKFLDKDLNSRLSENFFLSIYFLEKLILKNKVLYL